MHSDNHSITQSLFSLKIFEKIYFKNHSDLVPLQPVLASDSSTRGLLKRYKTQTNNYSQLFEADSDFTSLIILFVLGQTF